MSATLSMKIALASDRKDYQEFLRVGLIVLSRSLSMQLHRFVTACLKPVDRGSFWRKAHRR